MELLNEIKEVYKNIQVSKYNKNKGVQTEEDLRLVLKSTQISKEARTEIIELWRQDPIRNLEEKYGKETTKRVFQKKKDENCEKELNQILSKFTEDEKIKIIEEHSH
jgi:hypothetical protein